MHYITIWSFIELQRLASDKFQPCLVGLQQGMYTNSGKQK
jgi:hypothetical protein